MVDVAEKFEKFSMFVQDMKNRKDSLDNQIADLKSDISVLDARKEAADKALIIIQKVALDTQRNLEAHFSYLPTLAMKAVTEDWPEFEAQMVIRRGQTECDMMFVEGESRQPPLKCAGGGPINVTSFVLQPAYWVLQKNRPTFLLDEPFKDVSPDLQEKVGEMLPLIRDKLKLQLIIVSHQEDVNINADKTFYVTKRGGLSYVKET